jgi:hypothetical protein
MSSQRGVSPHPVRGHGPVRAYAGPGALLGALLAVGAGCPVEPAGGFSEGDEPVEDEFFVPLDTGVIEETDLGRMWSCGGDWERCGEAYLAHPARAADFARPVDDCGAMREQIMRINVGEEPFPAAAAPLGTEALADALLDAAAMRHLLDPDTAEPLRATIVRDEQRQATDDPSATWREIEILFEDPWVAEAREIQGLLLLPPGDGPFPAALALPGHAERAQDYRDLHYGRYLPSRGVAVLILSPRAWGDQPTEDAVTMAQLCDGFTMVGLRAYEAILGLRYLASRPDTGGHPAAVLGHSGGSAVANVLARLDVPMAGVVTDLLSQYLQVSGFWGDDGDYFDYGRWLVDETALDIAPFADQINDLSTAPVPMLRLPYGYGDPALDEWFPPDPDPTDMARFRPINDFLDEVLDLPVG